MKNAGFLARETVKEATEMFRDADDEVFPKGGILSEIKSPGLTLDKLYNQMQKVVRGQMTLKSVSGIGSLVMRRTTWTWVSIPRASRSRALEQVCKFAILEHARVRKYRKKVVLSSTAHLRHRLETGIAGTTDSIVVDGKDEFRWSFWDGLKCPDLSKVEELTREGVTAQLTNIRTRNLVPQHQKEFAAIQKVIQGSSIATHSGSPSDGMEHNVWVLYDQFMQVSEKIALVVKLTNCSIRRSSFTMEDAFVFGKGTAGSSSTTPTRIKV